MGGGWKVDTKTVWVGESPLYGFWSPFCLSVALWPILPTSKIPPQTWKSCSGNIGLQAMPYVLLGGPKKGESCTGVVKGREMLLLLDPHGCKAAHLSCLLCWPQAHSSWRLWLSCWKGVLDKSFPVSPVRGDSPGGSYEGRRIILRGHCMWACYWRGTNTWSAGSQRSWELRLPGYDLKLAPVIRGLGERPKKAAGHSKWVLLMPVEGTYIRVWSWAATGRMDPCRYRPNLKSL